MRVDFPFTSPKGPLPGHQPRALKPFGAWTALLAVLIGLCLVAFPEATGGSGTPLRDRADRAELPFEERDSIAACGKRGVGISACLASEAALRPKAQALWGDRSPETRRHCLKTGSRYEPVGKLYTCLATTGITP